MNKLTLDDYRKYITPYLLCEQSNLINDALEHLIFDGVDIENYVDPIKNDVLEWYLVGYPLSTKLLAKGEMILSSSCGTWWCPRNASDESSFLHVPCIQEIIRESIDDESCN